MRDWITHYWNWSCAGRTLSGSRPGCLRWPRQFARGAEQQKAGLPRPLLSSFAGRRVLAAAAFHAALAGAMARVIIGTRMLRACREAARQGIRSRCDGNSQAQGGKRGSNEDLHRNSRFLLGRGVRLRWEGRWTYGTHLTNAFFWSVQSENTLVTWTVLLFSDDEV